MEAASSEGASVASTAGGEERPGRFTVVGGEASSSSPLEKDGYAKTNLTKWDLLRGTTFRQFR